jgi:hypothetical protein
MSWLIGSFLVVIFWIWLQERNGRRKLHQYVRPSLPFHFSDYHLACNLTCSHFVAPQVQQYVEKSGGY